MKPNDQPPIQLGFAITGSFCTFQKILEVLKKMAEQNYQIVPIFSQHSSQMDTRFQPADEFVKSV